MNILHFLSALSLSFVACQGLAQDFLKALAGTDVPMPMGWIVYTSHNPFGGHGWQVNLTGSAWYGLHMWEHYAFTQDKEYLKKEAYPMMKELCQYWEKNLKTLGAGAKGFIFVAIDYVSNADIFVVIGTSLKVYPAAGFINYAHHLVPKFVIDPGEMTQCEQLGFTHFKTNATDGMHMLIEAFNNL